MAMKNFSGGGSGTGRSASGDASNAKKVANVSGSPAKMGGSGKAPAEIGQPARGGMSSVPSAATAGAAMKNVPQSAYYSEAGECDEINQSAAGNPKGYYGDRNGR